MSFELIMEDMSPKPPPPFRLKDNRVVDKKTRYRTIDDGGKPWTFPVCYHGRGLRLEACGLCEFEYPRLERDQ